MLSGDMPTGLNVDKNATAYWDRLVAVTDAHGIPHTAILGNHEPYAGTGQNQSSPGTLARAWRRPLLIPPPTSIIHPTHPQHAHSHRNYA